MFSDLAVIHQFYASLNKNDIESVMNLLDENIVRSEFEGLPSAGTYRGHSELRKHIIAGRSTWAEGSCEPIDFFPQGNKTVVIVHVKVRLKESSNWIDAKTADGFAVKDGRVTEFHSFVNQEKAFEWLK